MLAQRCNKHWGLPGTRAGQDCPYCEPEPYELQATSDLHAAMERLELPADPTGLSGPGLHAWMRAHPDVWLKWQGSRRIAGFRMAGCRGGGWKWRGYGVSRQHRDYSTMDSGVVCTGLAPKEDQ